MAGNPEQLTSASRRRTTFRRLPADQRRGEVLAAAIDVFGQRPEQDVSIDDVAAAAGTSRASIYRCFDSKHELYIATMSELGSRLVKVLGQDMQGSPSEQLEQGLRHYFDFVEEYGSGFAALLRLGAPGNPEASRAILHDLRRLVYLWVYRALDVTAPSPIMEAAVHSWVAGVEGLSLDWSRRRHLRRADLERLLSLQLSLTLLAAAALDPESADRVEWLTSVETPTGPLAGDLRRLAGVFTLPLVSRLAGLLSEPTG